MYDKVNFKKFVTDWQKAENVKEVAEKHNLSQADCSRLTAILRKKGVELKKFRVRTNLDFDVEELNKAIGIKN